MTTIGIDLGTSNSLVAFWCDNGPELIPNALGEYLTSSVVSIDDNGEILVGQIAKERLITHPHATAAAFKRYMGTEKLFKLGQYSFSPEELDTIILIGGATRMPIIKSTVSKMFGRLPYSQINPDESVAIGAAIQVALKERNEALKEIILTDVCPYTLGTDIVKRTASGFEDGHYLPIIERNTPIPVSKVKRLYTVNDDQTAILTEIYQGGSRRVENNIKLGELKVEVPKGPAGQESIDIRYTYDINGILEVEVTIVSTGLKKNMIIEKNPGSLSPEEIEARLNELRDIKIHPRDRAENRLLLARGERMYEESLGDKRTEIAYLLEKFEAVLATQDQQLIKKATLAFKKQLDHLEGWFDY
ncbi:Hsp70 family protein [Brevibacillus sp. RS1.1]|uniref:Hsp70 family protein n=1 Tax=Brevibacillus sp. RS1.1 TaxID=2738982 RepID=UPI00156B2C20|nr:Hsp70 family protein [Brevibacillus sp. RS1.1]NRR03255.1 Hsp70 family protein [Brevibacillus sp. RS1.1]